MGALTLNEALESYEHAKAGSYSPATWRAIDGCLERLRTALVRELGPNVYLDQITERVMSDYFNRLRGKVAPASFNNYRQYSRAFFGYCRGEDWIPRDPMRHVDPQKPKRKIRLVLSATEMLLMLEQAEPRDRIAMALGMNTALRAQDIMRLTVGNVDLQSGYITAWIEKTDSEESLPITEELATELLSWLNHYAMVMNVTVSALPNEWRLIPPIQSFAARLTTTGGQVRGWTYRTDGRIRHPEEIIHRGLRGIGHETKGQGLHTLRRSAARAVMELAEADGDGNPIRIAQALLGHKNQSTTEGYLGVSPERKRRDGIMRGKTFLGRVAAIDAARANHGGTANLRSVNGGQ